MGDFSIVVEQSEEVVMVVYQRKLLGLLVVCLCLVGFSSVIENPVSAKNSGQPNGATIQAFWVNDVPAQDVRIIVKGWIGIYDEWGAIFDPNAIAAASPKFVGPGGYNATCGSSGGCIDEWDWTGNPRTTLLLPKRNWIWSNPDSKQPANYEANLFYN
jgi:hypothetical protein